MDGYYRIKLTFVALIVVLSCLITSTKAQCNPGESEASGKCFYTTDVARRLTFDFSWVYKTLNQPLTAALKVQLNNLLINKFDQFSTQLKSLDKNLKRYFCPSEDCSKISMTFTDKSGGAVMAVFHADDLYDLISESPSEQSSGLLKQYFDSGSFELQAFGDLKNNLSTSDLNLTTISYCAPGYERVKPSVDSFIYLCGACLEGQYQNSTTGLCTLCPKGYYQGSHSQTSCKSCDTGDTTKLPGQTSKDSCEVEVLCDPGQFVSSRSNCGTCQLGFYQPTRGSQTSCMLCGQGKITYTTSTVLQSQCFDECSPGYKLLENGTCVACPLGTYLGFPKYQRECMTCPNNLTTESTGTASSDLCQNIRCSAGFVRQGSNPGVCVVCPKGTYRTSEMPICTSCGDASRWRTDLAGSASKDDCKFFCPAGSYITEDAVQKTCTDCPQDTYKISTEYYATACSVCPSDRPKTLTKSSTSIDDCKYARCSKGQEISLSNPLICVDCNYGYYQIVNEPIGQRCIKCLDQTSTRVRGAQSVLQCEAFCNSGFEMDESNNCVQCKRGFYKDNNKGVDAMFGKCEPCPADFVTPSIGATSQAACTIRNCSAGEFVTNQNTCQKCERGFYQNLRFQTSCIKCPDTESTTTQQGSTSEADCSVFLFRTRIAFKIKFNMDWKAEYYDHSSTSYLQLANRMNKQVDKTLTAIEAYRQGLRLITMSEGSVAAHMIAKFNKQNPNLRSDFIRVMDAAVANGQLSDVVVDGTQPLPVDSRQSKVYEFAFKQDGDPDECQYGYFYNYGTASCDKCLIGTYQSDNIGDICLPCPTGYSTTSSGRFGDVNDVCLLLCEEGKETINGVCTPCEKGSYKAALSVFKCAKCDTGETTQNVGSTSSSQCIKACDPGFFSNENKICSRCPRDQYNPLPNQETCLNCPLNTKTLVDGATSSTQCLNNCQIDQPCLNGATCQWSSTDSDFTCICTSDYEGKRCETEKDVCTKLQPCLNGGTCALSSVESSYTCSCQSGFSGDRCQTKDICKELQPCLNGGTCALNPVDSSYTCSCQTGFSGDRCQTKDICGDSQPCLNGGTCALNPVDSSYSCSCQTDFSGDRCQTKAAVKDEGGSNVMYLAIGVSVGCLVIIVLVVVVTVCLCRRRPNKNKPPPLPVVESNNNMNINTSTLPKTQGPSTTTTPVPTASPSTTALQNTPLPPVPTTPTLPKQTTETVPTTPTANHTPVMPVLPRSPGFLHTESITPRQNTEPALNVTTVSLTASHEMISQRSAKPPDSPIHNSRRRSPSPGRKSRERRSSSPSKSNKPQNSPARLRRSTIEQETPFSMPPMTNPLLEETGPADYPFDIPPANLNYPNERPNLQWSENTIPKPPPYSKNDPHKKKKKPKKVKGKKHVTIDTDRNEVHNMSVRSDTHIYMDIDDPNYLKPADALNQNVPASSRRVTNVQSPTYGFYQ